MRLYSIMKDFLTMKEYLPMEYFMKRYDVSRRTIQNDLSYLIQISSRNGYQLHMRRGNGYLLEVINDRLLDEFMKSLEHETMFDMKAVSYTHLDVYKRQPESLPYRFRKTSQRMPNIQQYAVPSSLAMYRRSRRNVF